jgi:hypothetical protein
MWPDAANSGRTGQAESADNTVAGETVVPARAAVGRSRRIGLADDRPMSGSFRVRTAPATPRAPIPPGSRRYGKHHHPLASSRVRTVPCCPAARGSSVVSYATFTVVRPEVVPRCRAGTHPSPGKQSCRRSRPLAAEVCHVDDVARSDLTRLPVGGRVRFPASARTDEILRRTGGRWPVRRSCCDDRSPRSGRG